MASGPAPTNWKKMIRLILSIALGVGLLVLLFWNVDFDIFWGAIRGISVGWWLAACGAFTLLHVVRAFRWYLIIKRVKPISFRDAFSITAVGFLAIQALPFRLGEFARPYLLLERKDIPFGSGMYTVVMERTLDILGLGACFTIAVLFADIPLATFTIGDWTVSFVGEGRKAVAIALVPFGGCLLAFLVLGERAVAWTESIVGRFHKGLAFRLTGLIRSFLVGVQTMKDWRFGINMTVTTVVLWAINAVGMWFMCLAFGFEGLGLMAGLVLLVVLIIGILLPAPPLFAGIFEAFIIGGLALYGVDKDPAAAYAVVLHTSTLVILCSLGVFFLWVDQMSFRKIAQFAKELREGAGPPSSGTPADG